MLINYLKETMKKTSSAGLILVMLLVFGVSSGFAQRNKAINMFKNHINNVVQKVKETKNPQKKRSILNNSFDNMLTAFNKAEKMKHLSKKDQAGLNKLSATIARKKYELNGTHGYKRVSNNQLNDYANYVQQNVEQASQTITLSLTAILLIIILIILLVAL